MGAGFTPGPWTVFAEGKGYPGIEAFGVSVVVFGDCENSTDDGGVRGPEDDENELGIALANARLIAAAPELYEALEEALDDLAIVIRSRSFEGEGSEEQYLAKGRAALAKAKGGDAT